MDKKDNIEDVRERTQKDYKLFPLHPGTAIDMIMRARDDVQVVLDAYDEIQVAYFALQKVSEVSVGAPVVDKIKELVANESAANVARLYEEYKTKAIEAKRERFAVDALKLVDVAKVALETMGDGIAKHTEDTNLQKMYRETKAYENLELAVSVLEMRYIT